MRNALIVMGLLIGCTGSAETGAPEPASTSIISRSPFIPSGFNPAAQSAAGNPAQVSATGYEFRGVYQIGDRYWFLISEPKSRDGNWIELGKNHDDIEARRYDPETKSLTVYSNNSEYTLALAELDSNPTPIPVQGLVKTASRTPTIAPTPVRRTIRPTDTAAQTSVTRPDPQRPQSSTPPPAWLEKLRAEAAERRAQATNQSQNNPADQDPRRRTITPNRPPQEMDEEDEGPDGRLDPSLRSR